MSEPSAKTCRHGVAHDGICFSCSQLDLHKVQAVADLNECGCVGVPGHGVQVCSKHDLSKKPAEPVEEIKSKAVSVYCKAVPMSDTIDIYRILVAFKVTDPCISHAIKKLLCPGQRKAGKSAEQDVKEAMYSLQRWIEMRDEERK